MMPTHQQTTKWWWRFLATHNPFYVISALLTLYGLHISFRDNIDPTQGWLQLKLFIGYMSLLALTGILVVRFGQVWEDARTLFLLLLLLMVALSVSFDRVCLDDEYLGLRFLSVGLAASLALCEVLLRAIKVSLPWRYRAVFYIQLAILFGYPAWLGHLSLTDQLTPLAWWTMAFPTVVAGSLVLLMPAALSGPTKVKENGTPWNWPLYPWTLFVILGIGLAIRSVSLTFSFDPTKGFTSGFQAYFLVPILLAVLLVSAASTVRRGDGRSWLRFVVAPLALIALALPGAPQSVSQARYLELLQETLGSPVQITATLLLAYFAFLLVLGLRNAEWGILASLAVFSVVDRQTLGLNTLAEIQLVPATLALLLLAIIAIARRSTARLALATVGLVGAAAYALPDTKFVADHYYVPIHLTTISLSPHSLACLGYVASFWSRCHRLEKEPPLARFSLANTLRWHFRMPFGGVLLWFEHNPGLPAGKKLDPLGNRIPDAGPPRKLCERRADSALVSSDSTVAFGDRATTERAIACKRESANQRSLQTQDLPLGYEED